MYDPILAKSFSRYDRRRFGCFALLLSFIIAFTICSIFSSSLSSVGDAVTMQPSVNAMEGLLLQHEIPHFSDQKIDRWKNQQMLELELPRLDQQNNSDVPEKELRQPRRNDGEPFCRVLNGSADFCEIEGDVRVDANSSTIFVVNPTTTTTSSWIIEPHPRKGIVSVKPWTVRLVGGGRAAVPKCNQNHSAPALLFSMGGFTGNYFHDFADLLFPIFATSFQFERDVQFLASEYKPWWLTKYRLLLRHLSRHVTLDIDHEQHVHCYSRLTAGLRFHSELVVAEPSSEATMSRFRQLLRRAYSLGRKTTATATAARAKPRLLIVSRKWTRIISNEAEVSRTARRLGYEVVSAESNASSNLTAAAQLVNSCDVMMGIHGAGLTNMVFLPEKAVVIQIVPLGGLDEIAQRDFGDPSEGMKIGYLGYKIGVEESSLSEKYPADHAVIKDPMSVHRQGWEKLKEVYLSNQNVTLDVRRFRGYLAKALKLLRR